MEARMSHPVMIIPEAMEALQSLGKATAKGGVSRRTRELVELRASQINGCSVCVDGHSRMLRQAGESEERICSVAAWRDAVCFSDAERAALALSESVTRLNDRADPVPDGVWDEAARHFDEKGLAALLLSIAQINVWNRLNVSIRQPVGVWVP